MDKKQINVNYNDQRLPKKEILKKKNEFGNVFNNGKRYNGTYLRFIFVEADGRKVGFAVSKKHGNAVYRNRIKRLMREAYRKMRYEIGHYHIVMISNVKSEKASYRELDKDMKKFISSLGDC